MSRRVATLQQTVQKVQSQVSGGVNRSRLNNVKERLKISNKDLIRPGSVIKTNPNINLPRQRIDARNDAILILRGLTKDMQMEHRKKLLLLATYGTHDDISRHAKELISTYASGQSFLMLMAVIRSAHQNSGVRDILSEAMLRTTTEDVFRKIIQGRTKKKNAKLQMLAKSKNMINALFEPAVNKTKAHTRINPNNTLYKMLSLNNSVFTSIPDLQKAVKAVIRRYPDEDELKPALLKFQCIVALSTSRPNVSRINDNCLKYLQRLKNLKENERRKVTNNIMNEAKRKLIEANTRAAVKQPR